MIHCPDCGADVLPVFTDACRAITCTPSGGHYVCQGKPGHSVSAKLHDWRWRGADGVLKPVETPAMKAKATKAKNAAPIKAPTRG